MRRYQPLTKSNGWVPHSLNHNTNPYYGQHGADWVKDTNASLFNAQHEHLQSKSHVERRVRHNVRQVCGWSWRFLPCYLVVLSCSH
ncbi:hypothetical protein P3T69_02450 [Lactiplantibacillus plantarum]|nr:hypothetical protein P3T69_02450 [Lactiplantibacillus plantarum]